MTLGLGPFGAGTEHGLNMGVLPQFTKVLTPSVIVLGGGAFRR